MRTDWVTACGTVDWAFERRVWLVMVSECVSEG